MASIRYYGDMTRIESTIQYRNPDSGPLRTLFAGDTLLNPKTGELFECTTRTYKELPLKQPYYWPISDFKYLRTELISSPKDTVSSLTLKRNSGYNFSLSWTNPQSLTSKDSCTRAEGFMISVEVLRGSSVIDKSEIGINGIVTSWSSNVFGYTNSGTDYLFHRDVYEPYGGTKRADMIKFTVVPKNAKGKCHEAKSVTYKFLPPNNPTKPEKYTVNATTGAVSQKFSSPKNTSGANDCVFTKTFKRVYDSRTGKQTTTNDATRSEGTFTLTQDVPNRQSLAYGDHVLVTLGATACGINADMVVVTDVLICFPDKPTITVRSVSEDWTGGFVLVGIDTGRKYARTTNNAAGVTNVRLQYLRSTTYQNPSEIPVSAQWTNIGPAESASCSAISIGIPDILPSAGTYTCVRAKSWNEVEGLYYRYSEPIRITELETPAPVIPSAGDDVAEILSHTVNADGTGVELLVGWDADGEDDSNNTEVSWATNEKAWRSTKQPDTFMFDDSEWDEGQVTVGTKTYHKSTHITVSELEVNTKYYMACRRVLEPSEGDTSYGPYSTKYIVNTSNATALPQSVTLYAYNSMVYGEPLQLTWTYGSQMEQSSWMLKKAVNGTTYDDDDIILATEDDQRHAYNLPFYRDAGMQYPIVSDEEDELVLYVVVTVSSVTLTSELVRVRVLRKPEFDIVAPDYTIVQPATLAVFSDTNNTNVSAFMGVTGVTYEGPDGKVEQTEGDSVWSETINPQWELIDEYASDADVQQAKEDLDDAQEAYDLVLSQYEDATSRRDDALARIETLTASIARAERDIPTAEATLQDAQDRLDGVGEDDPMHDLYETQAQEAADRLQELEDQLDDDTEALAIAEDDLQHWMEYAERKVTSLSAKGWAEQGENPSPENPQKIRVARGRNLLDLVGGSNNELTGSILADGRVRVTGTSTSTTAVIQVIPDRPMENLIAGETYTFSVSGRVNVHHVTLFGTDDKSQFTNLADTQTDGNVTFTLPKQFAYYRLNVCGKENTANITYDETIAIQLELGSTPTPYVPYGHVGLETHVENVLDEESYTEDGAYLNASGNVYRASDTTNWLISEYIPVSCGRCVFTTTVTGLNPGYVVYNSNKEVILSGAYGGSTAVSIDIPANATFIRVTFIKPSFSSTAHSELSFTSVTPIPLPSKGFAASLPDGTADTLTLDEAGKVSWELWTEEVVFDGSEGTWNLHSTIASWFYKDNLIADMNYNKGQSSSTSALASSFAQYPYSDVTNIAHGKFAFGLVSSSNDKRFVLKNTDFTDKTAFTTWLSTHPVTVLYPLATPVTEDIGYVDLPSIPAHATTSIPELDDLGIEYRVTIEDEEEALQQAIDAYATAEVEAIDPTSDLLAYKALIILPTKLNLVDGARYLVHGFSTDTQSGIRSDERTTVMNVAWAHQAPTPSENITVEPFDTTSTEGVRSIGAVITLENPVNSFTADVYDVYRVTKGSTFLAASDVPLSCELVDSYATFNSEPCQYRIACRTADGDVTWKDYSYILQESTDMLRSMMRIDWEDEYVELERNLTQSDAYEKQFTSHVHLDGSVSGHWNAGTMRTMSVSAALVRGYETIKVEAIERLSRYNGPCYVRMSDGMALECNVQVDSISRNRKSARIDLSLTLTEIESTGTFAATVRETE